MEAVAAVVTVGTICVATAATVRITKTILAVKNQEKKKKEVVLLPKEKDLKREKLRKKPQNEQIKPRIQL